jgi:hypothetical protein
MEFRATKRIGYNVLKGCNTHEYPDGTGLQTERQTRLRSTKNKMEKSTVSYRLNFHRTGPRCRTSVYVHDDDDEIYLSLNITLLVKQ